MTFLHKSNSLAPARQSEGRSLRVYMLLTQMEPGGAQNAAIKLARGLEAGGHTVTIGAMYDKAAYVPDFRQRFGVDLVDLGFADPRQPRGLAWFGRRLSGLGRLWRQLRHGDYDVLLTFTTYSNLIGPLVGWLAGVPVRVTSQRSLLDSYPGWLRTADRLVTNSRLVHKMTAVSNAVRDYSIHKQGIAPSKLLTIYTGIDTTLYQPANAAEIRAEARAELGLADDDVVVVQVGRLHPAKGYVYLLEAAPRVLARAPNCHFLFVGEGPLEGLLVTGIEAAGLADSIHLLGVRSDIPRVLLASDIMVLASVEEGLPNVVLEGMAAGLPVVATCVGGNPELVVDGVTGLLPPPADSVALADALLSLIEDPAEAQAIGANGRKRVATHFVATQTTAEYLSLFTQLLQSKGVELHIEPIA